MTKIKGLILLYIIFFLSGCVHLQQNDNPPKRILFVGNSLTYYNDVPAMVAEMYSVIDERHNVETELLAQAGYSIEQHLNNDILESTLTTEQYDIVILQEFGGWPLCSADFESCSSTSEPLSEAIDLIRLSGARPIWFSTHHQIPELQRMLSKESHRIALNLNVEMADVGAAMLTFSIKNDSLDSVLPNQHPNTLGSWIAAATIVRAIIGKTLPETLVLDSTCRSIWQGSDLKANQLASGQQSITKECDRLDSGLLQKVVKAVNHSFNTEVNLFEQ